MVAGKSGATKDLQGECLFENEANSEENRTERWRVGPDNIELLDPAMLECRPESPILLLRSV